MKKMIFRLLPLLVSLITVAMACGSPSPGAGNDMDKNYGDKNDTPDDRKQLNFRVASYNVRMAAEADVTSGNAWEVRKFPLTKLITDYGFDVVGTQEANAAQVADMLALMPDYACVAYPYAGQSGDLHNCAIFYRKDKFAATDQGVFWYSPTPDEPSTGWDAHDRRICSWVRLRELGSGTEFYFFDSHFYYRYTTAKQNSGPLHKEKVAQIAGPMPVISTGDFNSSPTTSQIRTILTLLRDAHDITESAPQGPEGTGLAGGVFKGPPGGRIDYIFVSPHFRVLDYMVIPDTYNDGHYPSDHLPVTSEVAIEIK